jgi:hypothetical protein
MGVLELMKRDANKITTDLAGFSQPVTFRAPTGEIATVNALHTKHYLGYDIDTAQEINTLKAHICVSEQELCALSYPVRNEVTNQVALKDHIVIATDANGTEWVYIVREIFPNEKIGVIALVLGSHTQ